jgi:para-aminobenzoate synthetase component 1
MTGAPKHRAMELIESHENFKRGLFSGSIGYVDPNGDFDFNVVIRTLIYNSDKNSLSCSVGSAITIHSDPEKEYEECLVKVRRIMEGINE